MPARRTSTSDWTWATTASNTTSIALNYYGESSVTAKAAPPKPKTALEWLREQVDEVCQLARAE